MAAPLFERASASKALAMTTLVCTGATFYLELTAEGLGKKLSPKALLTSQTMFKKFFPEMVFGLGLIYVFKQLERELGTKKFVSFCVASTTISVSLQLVLLSLLDDGKVLAPGPYAPIFSLMVLYWVYVPAIGTPIGSFKINHKLPVYLMGFLLATQEGRESMIPACCSLVAGIICFYQLKRLIMPASIARFGAKYIEPLFRSDQAQFPRGANGHPMFGGDAPHRQVNPFHDPQIGGGAGPQDDVLMPRLFGRPPRSAAANAIPEPRDEDIQTLVGMGFDAVAAANALRRNRNDVGRAAEDLVSQM